MKETGIIMSGNHPRLILDGLKTQTRRVIKPQPEIVGDNVITCLHWKGKNCGSIRGNGQDWLKTQCPYGQVGDRLWVRETYYIDESAELKEDGIFYRADDPDIDLAGNKWKPSIFMPRWASRILLEITELRAERLQEITERDAEAEGLNPTEYNNPNAYADFPCTNQFIALWDSLNAKRGYDWEVNPWVWVISFRIVNT